MLAVIHALKCLTKSILVIPQQGTAGTPSLLLFEYLGDPDFKGRSSFRLQHVPGDVDYVPS